MTQLPKAPAAVYVDADGDTVVAGQPVAVTVRIVADHPLQVVGGEVELIRNSAVTRFRRQWMGAGGAVSLRSSAVAARADLEPAGPPTTGQELTLTVPPGEASIAGYLVQQDYVLRARVRFDGFREAEGDRALRVGSTAGPAPMGGEGAPEVQDAGFAELGLADLSTRTLTGGETVDGTVTVTPRQAGTTRGLRVELVLDEHVPARADEPLEEDRRRTTVVTTVPLSGAADLGPGRVLRLPFTMAVPCPLPAPTLSTPDFTLRWLLRAVLDRPLRADPCTTLELYGTTAG
jgi:hypothetical protein